MIGIYECMQLPSAEPDTVLSSPVLSTWPGDGALQSFRQGEFPSLTRKCQELNLGVAAFF